jgi:HEAT repeat protein
MKAKRLYVIGFVLAGFALLLAFARLLHSDEPAYQGKPVSVWFKEYAFASNSPALAVWSYHSDGRRLIVQTSSGIHPILLPIFTNSAQQILWTQLQISQMRSSPPHPAWVALQALGSNAVPHLVRCLHISRLDRAYERVFANLPAFLQLNLPNPAQKKWYRTRALQTIARLGDPARAASPALLELLKQNDPWLRRDVISALRSIHSDRPITAVLLQLGAQQRYAEVTAIAWETGWEGSELTCLFGRMLRSPDPESRRSAMRLLERVGADAAPALEQVTVALKDSDSEVRYLAARSLVYAGTNTPQVITALRASLADENVMVRNVARRALLRFSPDAVPPPETHGVGDN